MREFHSLFERRGRAIAVARGDHLFRQGDTDGSVYFVRSGLLKAYYLRPDGREHIKSFLPEGSVIGSLVAATREGACPFSLVAAEDGTLLSLRYEMLRGAARGDMTLAAALIDFLMAYGMRKERREHELLTLSPEQRYALFRETMPHLVDRVSLADQAAYIGVTPQALSRIRRREKAAA